ncbi:MAG: 1-phosphofructokinase family hexose kinase [Nitriliruptoraceae bacterium]
MPDRTASTTDPRCSATAGPIAVLAPSVRVSVTIEPGDAADDIHIHAGGQGLWVARALRQLGHDALACAPVGGESGRTLRGLIEGWGVHLHRVDTTSDTPTVVQDRRDGHRLELARSRHPSLRRHELDELYSRFLALAIEAGSCVITGPEELAIPVGDLYRRLGHDLHAAEVPTVADLHGHALDAFLAGGPIALLKLSTRDLVADGQLDASVTGSAQEAVIDEVMTDLLDRGVDHVVVSRSAEPLLTATAEQRFRVTGPELAPVDTHGSGDTMTAALASGLVLGLDTTSLLARAWAAGSASVTRHGLGSADAGLIDELADHTSVEERC